MMDTVVAAAQRRRSRTARESGPQPGPEDLVRAKALFDRGLMLDAYRSLAHLAPLREWRGAEAMILAGRIAHHLGAPMLADGLMLLARRHHPDHIRARYYGVRAILARRGPLEGLEAIEAYEVPDGDAVMRAEWLALRAQILGLLRDFSAANADIGEALAIAPDHPWLALEHASLLEEQDRTEEALAEAQRGHRLRPLHPGANMALAHLFVLLGRDADAMSVLEQASSVIQSSALVSMLAALLTEHGLYDEALRQWEKCERLMPIVEKPMRAYIVGHLSHLHYLAGNVEESRRLALESRDPVLERVAARLAQPREGKKRVHLRVPFIHQHYVTCAPTTMAMLARFWNRKVEHLQIADEITYGGTAAHKERTWAEANGWATREFTLTWDAAVALLDRGIPFAMTTVSGDRAHEQAVVGYDTHRDTLLSRDPSNPGLTEIDFEVLLRVHQSTGPRAMVMLPRDFENLLAGIELKETTEHDIEHRLALALDRNDRAAAAACVAELRATAPESIVTLSAEQMLAIYDRNTERLLEVVEAALARFPEDVSLLLTKTRCLAELSRMQERTAMLHELANGEASHPLFLRLYADALSRDASQSEQALALIRRFLRMAGVDADGFRALAGIEWVLGNVARATKLYRLSSCVADTSEHHANSYYLAASMAGKADEAVAYLRQRVERFASQSAGPSQTLFNALSQTHRPEDAFAVIGEAILRRSDDPELLLFAADASARYGRFEEAETYLEQAEEIARRPDYLAALGNVRRYQGNLAAALEAWLEVHELEPLSPEAHGAVADLLAQVRGRAEALAFMQRLVERFPTYQPAWGLLVSNLRDVDPVRHEEAIRKMLAIAPRDAWAERELALSLAVQRRYDEAIAACDRAAMIERESPTNATVRARVAMLAGRTEEAKEGYLRAIDLSADEQFAIYGLAEACRDGHDRREVFRKLVRELIDRSSAGEALLAAYPVAADAVDPEEMLALARHAVATRAALWQSHSILIRQLLRMSKNDDAVERAVVATKRFAMQPAIWVDAAEAFGAAGHGAKQVEALRAAVRIEPTNAEPAIALARVLMRQANENEAIAVLSEAVARIPLDGTMHWILGGLLTDAGRAEEGLERLARAARLSPRDEGIWSDLQRAAQEAARPGLPREVAMELANERPGDPVVWIALSRAEEDIEAQLAAVDRAIVADRSFEGAYHRKTEILAGAERYDEAIDVCTAAAAATNGSVGLRARGAWLRAMRGDLDDAISTMESIVAAEPAYSWGWFQLCQWYSASGDIEKQKAAAQQLTRLEYSSTTAWNHLGDAELRSGNLREAEKAFTRALSIDPDNAYAGLWLIDILLDSKRIARAAEVAAQCEQRTGLPDFKLKKIEIAIRKEATGDAMSLLREIVLDPKADESLVDSALVRVREVAPDKAFHDFVQALAQNPSAHAAATGEWVRCLADRGKWNDALETIRQNEGAKAISAASAYLDSVGRARNWKPFEKYLAVHRTWSFQENELWAMTGYCQNVFANFEETVSWMGSWESRTGLAPWMLVNVVIACRNTGRDEIAARASERALALPEDGATQVHHIWLGLDAAFDGDIELAEAHLSEADLESVDLLHRHVARIGWTLVVAAREAAQGKNWRVGAAQLDEIIAAGKQRAVSPLVHRLFKRCVAHLKQRYGRWTDALWLLNLKMKL